MKSYLVTCLLTIYNKNWHLGIVTTAMFYIPKIIYVGHVKDDCSHSGGPIRENCKGRPHRKDMSPHSEVHFFWCFISNSEYFYKTSYIINGLSV